jgi:hypothetical protein
MSADRAGIIACGRPSAAIAAQVKLSVGPTVYRHVNLADLARQAADLHQGVGRVEGFVSQLGASHPFLVNRIRAMLDFLCEQPACEQPAEEVAPPPRARLRLRAAGATPEYVLLGERPSVGGRSPSSDLRLEDRAVSRRHFEIAWEPAEDGFVIRDLGSNNGTFVNGRRVGAARLRDGDVVRVGSTELEFSVGH